MKTKIKLAVLTLACAAISVGAQQPTTVQPYDFVINGNTLWLNHANYTNQFISVDTNGVFNASGGFQICDLGITNSSGQTIETRASNVVATMNVQTNIVGITVPANMTNAANQFVASNILVATFTNKATAYIPTNTAPLRVVLNPLTSGVAYTTPAQRGRITINLSITNAATGYLTNATSHEGWVFGGQTPGIWTNNVSFSCSTSPADVILMTNGAGGANIIPILFSSWESQ